MNETLVIAPARWILSAGSYALAAVLMVGPYPLHAGQSSSQFTVTVNLQTGAAPPGAAPPGAAPPAATAFCRISDDPSAFGAIVTTVCSTNAVVGIAPGRPGAPLSPMHGGAYRFATGVSRSANGFDVVDVSPGIGTTTSWRMVSLANRDYLEMMLAW